MEGRGGSEALQHPVLPSSSSGGGKLACPARGWASGQDSPFEPLFPKLVKQNEAGNFRQLLECVGSLLQPLKRQSFLLQVHATFAFSPTRTPNTHITGLEFPAFGVSLLAFPFFVFRFLHLHCGLSRRRRGSGLFTPSGFHLPESPRWTRHVEPSILLVSFLDWCPLPSNPRDPSPDYSRNLPVTSASLAARSLSERSTGTAPAHH